MPTALLRHAAARTVATAAVLLTGCLDTPPSPNVWPAEKSYLGCLHGSYSLDCTAHAMVTNLMTGKVVHKDSGINAVHLAAESTGSTIVIPYQITNLASPSTAAAVYIHEVTFDYTAPPGGDGSGTPALQCTRSDGLACSDPKATWLAIVPEALKPGEGQTTSEVVTVQVRHVDSVARSAKLCFRFDGAAAMDGPICVLVQVDVGQ